MKILNKLKDKSSDIIIKNARKNGYIWPYEIEFLEGSGLTKDEILALNRCKKKYDTNNINFYSMECIKKQIFDETMYLDYKFKYKLITNTQIEPKHLMNLLDDNTLSFYSIVKDYNKNLIIRFENQEDYLFAKLSNLYGQSKYFIENEAKN